MWSSLLLAASTAHAGACCVGSTGSAPVGLGECEHVLAAVYVAPQSVVGRWDAQGRARSSSLIERGANAGVAFAYRWNRKMQVSVDVPVVWTARQADKQVESSGGLGDAGVRFTWDPKEEGAGPVPVFTVGARAPTGRDWTDATLPLQSDITGRQYPSVQAGVSFERTFKRPWSVGLSTGVALGKEPSTVVLSGTYGKYLDRWTLVGGLSHELGFVPGGGASALSQRTSVSGRAVYGKRLRFRTWGEVGADVPVSYLGVSANQTAHVSAGVAVIR